MLLPLVPRSTEKNITKNIITRPKYILILVQGLNPNYKRSIIEKAC